MLFPIAFVVVFSPLTHLHLPYDSPGLCSSVGVVIIPNCGVCLWAEPWPSEISFLDAYFGPDIWNSILETEFLLSMFYSWVWWPMSVIPALGRLRQKDQGWVWGQPGLRSETQSQKKAGRQCLTPVILATQEAEIRRIAVQSQPRQIVRKSLSQKIPSQKRAGGVAQGVGPEFKPQYCKKKKKKTYSLRKVFAVFHHPSESICVTWSSCLLW
jgi:hypothetical protein